MDRLWDIIAKEHITVKYRALRHYGDQLFGLFLIQESVGPVIILDSELKCLPRLHKCVLSEEIGHYYTAPRSNYIVNAYTSSSQTIITNQDERKALQWATDFLMPDIEMVQAFKAGARSCFELAEYFDVTEWFVYRKLGFLKMCFRRTGLKVRGRDLYNIESNPCLWM